MPSEPLTGPCARCGSETTLAPDLVCWPCAVEYRDEIIAEMSRALDAERAARSTATGPVCTCMPFFAGHVTQHPDCPLGQREAAHPAAAVYTLEEVAE